MTLKVSLVIDQYGDSLVYINDHRVIGPDHGGLGHVVAIAIVDTDDLPKGEAPEEDK